MGAGWGGRMFKHSESLTGDAEGGAEVSDGEDGEERR